MGITKDPRQMAFSFPEPSLRVAPLPGRVPSPPAPVDAEAEAEAAWWAAHRARAAAMDAEWCELGEMLLAGCLAREQERLIVEAGLV